MGSGGFCVYVTASWMHHKQHSGPRWGNMQGVHKSNQSVALGLSDEQFLQLTSRACVHMCVCVYCQKAQLKTGCLESPITRIHWSGYCRLSELRDGGCMPYFMLQIPRRRFQLSILWSLPPRIPRNHDHQFEPIPSECGLVRGDWLASIYKSDSFRSPRRGFAALCDFSRFETRVQPALFSRGSGSLAAVSW